MKCRCITFNLKGIGSEWFERRFDSLVSALKPLSPDIVCLQESTISHDRDSLYNQARAIGEAVGLSIAAFASYGNPVEVMSRNQGGIALISRWPIGDVRNRRLCSGHDHVHDMRVAMFATLLSREGPIEVATTHLSWRPEEVEVRAMQMGIVLQELLAGQSMPNSRRILLGDLNATEDEPAIQLVSEHLQDAFRAKHSSEAGHTWDNKNPLTRDFTLPDRRVDYIFCQKETVIHSCDIVLNHPSPTYPSDHYGVMADLQW